MGEIPKTELQKRAETLAEVLPGLYSQTALARKKGFKMAALEERERVKLEELQGSLVQQQQAATTLIDEAYPVWSRLLAHWEPRVRAAAISRIPRSGSPLSILLPIFCSDANHACRLAAREKLGFAKKRTWLREVSRTIYTLEYTLAEVLKKEGKELEALYNDHRTTVRRAVAFKLPPDSPLWEEIAHDVSPRLRRMAAERVMLTAPCVKALCADDKAVVRAAISRRLIREWEPKQPATTLAVALDRGAVKARREAWQEAFVARARLADERAAFGAEGEEE
jgi:hypothetical protein